MNIILPGESGISKYDEDPNSPLYTEDKDIVMTKDEKNPVFYQKWQGQLAYNEKLLKNLNKARNKDEDRINEIEHNTQLIKEELSAD